ncbi:hypothetical protein PCANB_001469 [Pneumocystis canis]|nr:hypothetical protein PCK1_001545 [Pneumocystis canis]KAG5439170.1 hypothetical protein PCANB_001469 [Pneumocystis canis]
MQRITISSPEFRYFEVQWNETSHQILNAQALQQFITQMLKQMLGIMGTAIQIEILHITTCNKAYIRVPAKDSLRLWAAITGYSEMIITCQNNFQKGLRVIAIADYLMGLIHRSRTSIDFTTFNTEHKKIFNI